MKNSVMTPITTFYIANDIKYSTMFKKYLIDSINYLLPHIAELHYCQSVFIYITKCKWLRICWTNLFSWTVIRLKSKVVCFYIYSAIILNYQLSCLYFWWFFILYRGLSMNKFLASGIVNTQENFAKNVILKKLHRDDNIFYQVSEMTEFQKISEIRIFF